MTDQKQAAGVTFGSLAVLGPRAVIDIAQAADQMGYQSLWTVEANGTDAFSLLGAVSAVTPSMGHVGSYAAGIKPGSRRAAGCGCVCAGYSAPARAVSGGPADCRHA